MRKHIGCLLAAALVLSLAACQKGSTAPEGTKEGAATRAGGGSVTPRAAGPLLEGLADRLPKDSPMVAVVDVRGAIDAVKGLAAEYVPMVDMPALEADLSHVFERFVGFDPMKIDYLVAFVAPMHQSGGLFVAGPFKAVKLPGAQTKTVAGIDVLVVDDKAVLAAVEGGLFVGTPGALEDFLSKDDKLAGTELLKGHLAAFERVGGGAYVVSAHLAPYVAMLPSPFKGAKVSYVSLAGGGLDGHFAASMAGDKAARDMVKGVIDMGLGAARAFLSEQAAKIDSDKPEEAFAAVFAKHLGPAVLDLPQITVKDEALTVSVTVPGVQSYAIWAGMAAAVAIPAFVKYMKRARRGEADALCVEAYNHVIELAYKDKLPDAVVKELTSAGMRQKVLEECRKQDPAEIECTLRAESFSDIGKCSSK